MRDCRFRPTYSCYSSPQSPSRFDNIPISKIWQEYTKTESGDIRNYLIVNYLPLVKIQADRMARRLPLKIDKEDLMSDGVFGLTNAVETFDLGIGVTFEIYSAPRIRETIIEGLREMDWAPRLVRHRESKVKRIIREVKLKTGRPATDEDLAAELGITIEKFLRRSDRYKNSIKSDSQPAKLIPLYYRRKYHGVIVDKYWEIEPEYYAEESQPDKMLLLEELRSAARSLTEQEKAIVLLRYNNEITMEKIGKTLGVSQPRISQARKKILEKLERKCA